MSILKNSIALSIIGASAAILYKAYGHRRPQYSNGPKHHNTTDGKSDVNDNIDNSEQRNYKMFKDLEMTEAQQRKYNNSIKAVMSDWEKNNPNKSMDLKQTLKEEDKALNAVLNEMQYGMYRDWADRYKY
ncbi:hypothetical protein [Winogradskyella ursingii]|uniref:hypothetical protein n=1 Tax=Winogradskyella ursingii TaxID=2686079 RepID=UPI0015CA2FEB|nr:hypothetical protein [Winogradskyella ursingii]